MTWQLSIVEIFWQKVELLYHEVIETLLKVWKCNPLEK